MQFLLNVSFCLNVDVTQLQFQSPVYIFAESSGTVEVCVASMLPLARILSAQVKTQSGTAKGNVKYLRVGQLIAGSQCMLACLKL